MSLLRTHFSTRNSCAFHEYPIYFYLIDTAECAIDCVVFFFFSSGSEKAQSQFPSNLHQVYSTCLFVYRPQSWLLLIFPTLISPLSYFLHILNWIASCLAGVYAMLDVNK